MSAFVRGVLRRTHLTGVCSFMTYVTAVTETIEEDWSVEGRTDVRVDTTYVAAIVVCINDTIFRDGD